MGLSRKLSCLVYAGVWGQSLAFIQTESELGGLATGLNRDKAAVTGANTEPWSTSPVEGHINRLKRLKRQMYGRARYDVLRARMLAA